MTTNTPDRMSEKAWSIIKSHHRYATKPMGKCTVDGCNYQGHMVHNSMYFEMCMGHLSLRARLIESIESKIAELEKEFIG
jgi:hypothetical protein